MQRMNVNINNSKKNGKKWSEVYNIGLCDDFALEDFLNAVNFNYKLFQENIDNVYTLEENNRKESVINNICKCVDCALEYNNHSLFAKMLIEKLENDLQEMPSKIYLEKILSGKNLDKRKLVFLKNKAHYWRNANVEPVDDGLFIFKDNTSQKEDICFSKRLSDIKNGRVIINKDIAVQIGIVTGMTSEEVNKWLRMSGKAGLYILDIVDCIGIFYLNYYAEKDRQKLNTDKDFILNRDEGEKRLKQVKASINTYIKKLDMLPEKEGIKVLNQKKHGLSFGSQVISYDRKSKGSSRWNLLRLTEELRIGLDMSIEVKSSITLKFGNLVHMKDKNEFFMMLDNYLSYFKQLRYSYYEQCIAYMEDVNGAKKNLSFYGKINDYENAVGTIYCPGSFCGDELAAGDIDEPERIEHIQNNDFGYDEESQIGRLLKYIHNYNSGKALKTDNYYELVGYTYSAKNLLEKQYYYSQLEKSNDLYNKLRGDNRNVLRSFSKNDVLRFAVATGHENDIGNLMVSGGYWKADYTNKELILQSDIDYNDMDALDLYIIYIYEYRDRLIYEWSKENVDRNQKNIINALNSEFPMAVLMALASRDVQYYFGYIKNKSYTEKRIKDNSYRYKPDGYDAIQTELNKCLAFRTFNSEKEWFNRGDYSSKKRAEDFEEV